MLELDIGPQHMNSIGLVHGGVYATLLDVAMGSIGNPGGRPKLPAEIREMFQARSQEALEVLTRCLQSDDDRIAMMAAQAILDRGYGKPTQSIDANITEDGGPVRYYAELPRKADTAAPWLDHVNARRDSGSDTDQVSTIGTLPRGDA